MEKSFKLISISLLGLVLILSFLLFKKQSDLKILSDKNSAQIQGLQSVLTESIYFSAKPINLNNISLQTHAMDSVKVKLVALENDPKFVIRIKESQCMDCIDSLFMKINEITNDLDPDKVIVLSSFHDIGQVRSLLRIRNLPFKIYNTIEPVFEKTIEDIDEPLLFILDSLSTAKALFVFRVSRPDISRIYLQTIKRYLKKEYNSRYTITMAKTTSLLLGASSFDFGYINYDSPVNAVAKFKNKGKSPLVITAVVTGCGCTVARYPRTPLLPGHSSSISVSYDTKIIGTFNREIFVYSNAVESPQSIRIKGFVNDQK
jgi:hypothetical protein